MKRILTEKESDTIVDIHVQLHNIKETLKRISKRVDNRDRKLKHGNEDTLRAWHDSFSTAANELNMAADEIERQRSEIIDVVRLFEFVEVSDCRKDFDRTD